MPSIGPPFRGAGGDAVNVVEGAVIGEWIPRMSIYKTRYKYGINYDGSKTGMYAGVPATTLRPANAPGEVRDWTIKRRAEPANRLLPMGREWLAGLPPQVQPRTLALRYPRIANALAATWGDSPACSAYFSSLIDDQRGGRKGFPADVQRELLTLRDHYFARHMALTR
jgi:hypothetical protein